MNKIKVTLILMLCWSLNGYAQIYPDEQLNADTSGMFQVSGVDNVWSYVSLHSRNDSICILDGPCLFDLNDIDEGVLSVNYIDSETFTGFEILSIDDQANPTTTRIPFEVRQPILTQSSTGFTLSIDQAAPYDPYNPLMHIVRVNNELTAASVNDSITRVYIGRYDAFGFQITDHDSIDIIHPIPEPNTDDQALTLVGNILTLEDGGTVDLSAYLDDTDTDDQALTLVGNTLTLEDGGTVDLSAYLDNTDTDDQALTLVGNILTLEDGGTVDLSAYLDDTNTDDQALTLVGNILTLEDGGTVDLSAYLDNTDTDDQALTLVGNILTLEDGGTVDLSQYLDNTDTDDQALSLVGNTLTLEDGGTVDLSQYSSLFNLSGNRIVPNSNLHVLGGGFGGTGALNTTNFNTATMNGNVDNMYRAASGTNGPPKLNLYYHLLNWEYLTKDANGQITQMAVPYGLQPQGGFWYRGYTGSVWSDWRPMTPFTYDWVGSAAASTLKYEDGTIESKYGYECSPSVGFYPKMDALPPVGGFAIMAPPSISGSWARIVGGILREGQTEYTGSYGFRGTGNAVERYFIDISGNGLSTTDFVLLPHRLQVGLLAGTGQRLLHADASGNITPTVLGTGLSMNNGVLSATGSSPWTVSGTNIYRSGGNVGIGTTSPFFRLHVDGSVYINNGKIIDGFNSGGSNGQLLGVSGSENQYQNLQLSGSISSTGEIQITPFTSTASTQTLVMQIPDSEPDFAFANMTQVSNIGIGNTTAAINTSVDNGDVEADNALEEIRITTAGWYMMTVQGRVSAASAPTTDALLEIFVERNNSQDILIGFVEIDPIHFSNINFHISAPIQLSTSDDLQLEYSQGVEANTTLTVHASSWTVEKMK